MRAKLLVLFFSLALFAAAQSAQAEELTVAAAASLADALVDIGRQFEQAHPGTAVLFHFASSGILARQIELGAPIDVFAAAGPEPMEQLARKGLVEEQTRIDFAVNEIVLIQRADAATPLGGFQDLKDDRVRHIAMGNPAHVPAGRYAQEILHARGLWQEVQPKLVLADDVRQALTYVVRGEVDAGLVYRTDAVTAGSAVRVVGTAEDAAGFVARYPAAALRQSHHSELAASFVRFLATERARETLRRHGFLSVFP